MPLLACIHNHPTSPPQRGMSSEYSDFVLMWCLSCLLLWVRNLHFVGLNLGLGNDLIQYWVWCTTSTKQYCVLLPLPPRKIKMHSLGQCEKRMLFVLAYVTVSNITANKCATYEVNIIQIKTIGKLWRVNIIQIKTIDNFKGKDCISDVWYDLAGIDGRFGCMDNSCKWGVLLPSLLLCHCPHRTWSVAGIFYTGEVGMPHGG